MSYKELEVWRKSHQLVLRIYQLTNKFPVDERFRLVDQICRAALRYRLILPKEQDDIAKKNSCNFFI